MTPGPAFVVFAYAFPHRKTQDFLIELVLSAYPIACVIAAPWQELGHADRTRYFATALRNASPLDTRSICATLGVRYAELAHNDVEGIRELQNRHGFSLGIISGARILKRAVIDLFDHGVINFHPGKLPDTAGLDVFYHTIRTRAPAGVTAHFIDHRVDAGREIFFEETLLGPDDTPEIVQHNTFQTQLTSLRRLLGMLRDGQLRAEPIDRPRKNEPMTADQKCEMLRDFPVWRSAQFRAQQGRLLLRACEAGSEPEIEAILARIPDLIEHRSPEGWTPLIVAAFNQHRGCVRCLLERGADPNAMGRNGTTVIMYAKTALMNRQEAEYALLQMLLDAGASLDRCDALGNNIVHYVAEAGDMRLLDWLKA